MGKRKKRKKVYSAEYNDCMMVINHEITQEFAKELIAKIEASRCLTLKEDREIAERICKKGSE